MDIQISVTAVQIAEVGKCHKFEFENEKPPFECEANAPYVSNPLGLNPHKSAPFSAITSFLGRGTHKMGRQGGDTEAPKMPRGVNSGGTVCQATAAVPAGTMVLGFHSLLRGRMDIFGGDRHRPLSLQFLNANFQPTDFLCLLLNGFQERIDHGVNWLL